MVNIGLIGAGRWGARYISTIKNLEGVDLICVYSRNPLTSQLVLPNCRIFNNWEDLLCLPDLHGVIIATPPDTHFEIAMYALKKGIPFLVEKPFTSNLADSVKLFKQIHAASLPTLTGHVHLYSPAYKSFKNKVLSLGSVKSIKAQAGNVAQIRNNVPVLWDWGPHDVAMCIDLIGELPSRVSAIKTKNLIYDNAESIEIELFFRDEIRVSINLSNALPRKTRYMCVYSKKALVIYDDQAINKAYVLDGPGCEMLSSDQTTPLGNMIIEFMSLLKGEQVINEKDLNLSLSVIRILDLLDESIAGNGSMQFT